MNTSIRWLMWFVALCLLVFHCFWIIDQAYRYHRGVAELISLKKTLHTIDHANKQQHIALAYQKSLYHIEKTAQQQGLFYPKKIQVFVLNQRKNAQTKP